MVSISVMRYHHHDCNGNILLIIGETIDLVIGPHSAGMDDHENHCHHHHKCEDCSLKIGDFFTNDDHFSIEANYAPEFMTVLWSNLFIPVVKESFKNYFVRENIKIDSGVFSRLLSFRAPPAF